MALTRPHLEEIDRDAELLGFVGEVVLDTGARPDDDADRQNVEHGVVALKRSCLGMLAPAAAVAIPAISATLIGCSTARNKGTCDTASTSGATSWRPLCLRAAHPDARSQNLRRVLRCLYAGNESPAYGRAPTSMLPRSSGAIARSSA